MERPLMVKILIMIVPFMSITYVLSMTLTKKYKKIYYYFLVLLLFLLVGFQNNFGTDYMSYVNFYLGNRFYPNSKGILFKYLLKILKLFSENPRILFVTMSALYFYFLNKITSILKENGLIQEKILFLICVVVTIYLHFFNIIRASLAILCITLSYLLKIYNKNSKKYILYYLIALGFHPSTIIFLPFFIFQKNLRKKRSISFIVLTMVIAFILNMYKFIPKISKWLYSIIPYNFEYKYYLLIDAVLVPYKTQYDTSLVYQLLRSVGSVILLIFVLLFYIIEYKRVNNEKKLIIYNVGWIAFCFTFLSIGIPIFMRAVEIMSGFVLILKYNMIVNLSRSKYLHIGIIIFMFLYFIYIKNVLTMVHY